MPLLDAGQALQDDALVERDHERDQSAERHVDPVTLARFRKRFGQHLPPLLVDVVDALA